MKSKVFSLLLALVLLTVATGVFAKEDKVSICHKPGTEDEETISVAAPALGAHLAHGDTEGECGPVDTRSELCRTFDGLSVTFNTGETIFYSQEYLGTTLFHSENVTVSLENNDILPHAISIEITPAFAGQPVFKTLSSPLSAPAGSSAVATLINNVSPDSETDFRVSTLEDTLFLSPQEGSVTVSLACSAG